MSSDESSDSDSDKVFAELQDFIRDSDLDDDDDDEYFRIGQAVLPDSKDELDDFEFAGITTDYGITAIFDASLANNTQCSMSEEEGKKTVEIHADIAPSTLLEELLRLNRSKNAMLLQCYKTVSESLEACRKELATLRGHSIGNMLWRGHESDEERKEEGVLLEQTVEAEGDENEDSDLNIEVLRAVVHLGMPYFKTGDQQFSPEPNQDVIAKDRNGELFFYHSLMPEKWSRSELKSLREGVALNYSMNKLKHLNEKLEELQEKLDDVPLASENYTRTSKEIDELNAEVEGLRKKKDVPRRYCDDFIDWPHVCATYIRNQNRESDECKSLWNLLAHPHINKSKWSKKENEKLSRLVKKHERQDWDRVAEELGTDRTGFSVCVHYMSNLHEHFSNKQFGEEEDERLLKLIEKHRVGGFILWPAIEMEFQNRTRKQLVHRYKYFLNENKGAFNDAEDVLILVLVQRFGRNFAQFKRHFPEHSHMQIKHRYYSRFEIHNNRPFTLAEDERILRHMEENSTFANLKHSLGRNTNQIRQRYVVLKKFLTKNPDAELADAPRKKVKADTGADKKIEYLKSVAEKFGERVDVPTLEEIEETIGRNGQKNMDDLLTNFFANQMRLCDKSIATNSKEIEEAAIVIDQILIDWAVNLNIPNGNSLEESQDFDAIDVEILNKLTVRGNEKQAGCGGGGETERILIPPNVNTILGLRTLLLRNHLNKTSKNRRSPSSLNDDLPLIRNKMDEARFEMITSELGRLDEETREKVENERLKFMAIFESLFAWPAILSVVEYPEGYAAKRKCPDDENDRQNAKRIRRGGGGGGETTKKVPKKPNVVNRKTSRKRDVNEMYGENGGSILDVIEMTGGVPTTQQCNEDKSEKEHIEKLDETIKGNLKEFTRKISSKLASCKKIELGQRSKGGGGGGGGVALPIPPNRSDDLKKDVEMLNDLVNRETRK